MVRLWDFRLFASLITFLENHLAKISSFEHQQITHLPPTVMLFAWQDPQVIHYGLKSACSGKHLKLPIHPFASEDGFEVQTKAGQTLEAFNDFRN